MKTFRHFFCRRSAFACLLSALILLLELTSPKGWAATIKDIATDATDPSNAGDTEPSIAVNPSNPLEIAVVSFSGGWGPGNNGPVWRSTDGGATWSRALILPQPNAASSATGDQKIAFDAAGNLYVAELALGLTPPRLFVYRGPASAPLTVGSVYGSTNDDQPHLDVDRFSTSAFLNRLYSPWLDFAQSPERSTVANSTSGGATLTSVAAGDNSAFANRTSRMAVGPDGKAYLIYKKRQGTAGAAAGFENAQFTVARSDDGGVTWTALGASGVSVHSAATVQTFFTTSFGNPAKGKVARARSSDAWIAVDPSDGDVYAAYVSRDSASGFGQIFVARSTDSGSTWNSTRVTDNTHNCAYPEIAVADNGAIGVLYIDYDDSGAATLFRHRLARSFDNAGTWSDQILQSMDPAPMANAASGFLWGDYEGLTALGHTFYGVFTGASIGRTTTQLDPIFFKESATPPEGDFYVRDWTDTSASGDDGAEPSTHPVFYTTSDVWNRQTNAFGGFNANNQPQNEDAQTGSSAGNNFAFARVFRNTGGAPATVTAHFLYSEFGTGSNYVDAGSPAGQSISFGAGATDMVSNGHNWQLNPTTSSHLCLAVEISTPQDPFMPPSLLGRAPGWPTTDLDVINDNNKAQRNLGVFQVESGESCGASFYAVVHNAALSRREIKLRFGASPDLLKNARKARIEVVGGVTSPLADGLTLSIPNVAPGENRWIGFHFDSLGSKSADLPLIVTCSEMVGNRGVNGFAIGLHPAPLRAVITDTLEFDRNIRARLAAGWEETPGTPRDAESAKSDARQAGDETNYIELVQGRTKELSAAINRLLRLQKSSDPFRLRKSVALLETALRLRKISCVLAEHNKLLHRFDAFLTMLQKGKGDSADILQNVAWQRSTYATLPQLQKAKFTQVVQQRSMEFITAYQARKVGNEDYPKFLQDLLGSFKETASLLNASGIRLEPEIAAIEKAKGSLPALQQAHRNFLLKIHRLAK